MPYIMKILVLGASGYLGSRIYEALGPLFETVGTKHLSHDSLPGLRSLDITDTQSMRALMDEIRPDVIIHAANYSNVDWCEENPVESRRLNLDSTKEIVHAAVEIDSKLIFISSLAAGQSDSLYAAYKQASEIYIQESLCPEKFLIVRPSVIFGSSPHIPHGSVTAHLARWVASPEACTLDDTWRFFPTYIEDVIAVVMKGVSGNEPLITSINVHIAEKGTMQGIARDVLHERTREASRGSVELGDSHRAFRETEVLHVVEKIARYPVNGTYIEFIEELARNIANLNT